MEKDVITIDGPTSSGKNSVGLLLAQKLGYLYIDSGSIYRAGCFFILKNNIPLNDLEKVISVYKNLKIEITNQRFFANGEDVTDNLHDPEVTRIVSAVSAFRQVRETVKIIQYQITKNKNTVMTGRDIGSEIFPDAKYKFFLTADVNVRAERRFKQLIEKDAHITFDSVLKNMEDRDKQDSNREVSPLRIPQGAVIIDNSSLSIEETVNEMLKTINV